MVVVRGFLVAVIAMAGCSFAFVRPTARIPLEDLDCEPGAPIVDSLVVVGIGIVAANTFKDGRHDPTFAGAFDSAIHATFETFVVLPFFVGSAIYGFRQKAACVERRRGLRAKAEADAAAKAANERELAARDRAWELTKLARAAARTGDCVQVVKLDDEVNRIDDEFHSTVFVRDVAIARCLSSR